MNTKKRSTFATRLGAIMVSAGSAVGLGNIWRFPYEAGENGGALFIFFYIISAILIGMPIMLAEFYIGKHTKSGLAEAFPRLTKEKGWNVYCLLCLGAAFCFLGFYSVVSGWTLHYIWEAITNHLAGKDVGELQQSFESFCATPSKQYLWIWLFQIITFGILLGGVRNGLEKAANILMPILFVVLILMAVYSFFLPGIREGIQFLFYPDFSKFTWEVPFKAIGQAFFSLSLGYGVYITYSSYFTEQTNLIHTASAVCLLDTFVAMISGIIIFPAVFSFGIEPEAGTHLVFITLPNVFYQMWGGYFLAIAFFILLSIAALTSLMTTAEVCVAFLRDKFKISRRKSVLIMFLIAVGMSLICTISQGENASIKCCGIPIFELFDKIMSEYLLPIGGIILSIFMGWKVKKASFRDELTNNGKNRVYGFEVLIFLLRFVIPFFITLIFFKQIGII